MPNTLLSTKFSNMMSCPHCNDFVDIIEINCGIFRHGVFKDSFQQIDPHLPKSECERVLPLIYGCGKPFKYDGEKLVVCDYI